MKQPQQIFVGLILLAVVGGCPSKPSTFDDCLNEASKRPTEEGVELAEVVCGRTFALPQGPVPHVFYIAQSKQGQCYQYSTQASGEGSWSVTGIKDQSIVRISRDGDLEGEYVLKFVRGDVLPLTHRDGHWFVEGSSSETELYPTLRECLAGIAETNTGPGGERRRARD